MDKKPANEVVQKKISKKRKFQSVPNIAIENLRIKANDTFLVSPEDIRKFQQGNKGVDEKPKKSKAVSAKKTPKKANTKDMGKLLLEPNQVSEDKQIIQDYNWMIKKNIVKLMSAAKRKLQNEQKLQKAEKEKGADKEMPSTACPKSKAKKKERKKEEIVIKAVKSDVPPKSIVKKEKFESRAFSANIPQTRIQSAIRKDNLMILQPDVIKERDEKSAIRKILQQEPKIKEAKPKKGKKQTPEKSPDFAEFSSIMQAEKKKKKKTEKTPKERKKSTKQPQPVKVAQ